MQHPRRKDNKVRTSTNRLRQLALICGIGSVSLLAACGSNNSKPNGSTGGSGGTSTQGGSTSHGGANGGTSAAGGVSATGGTSSAGGVTSAGGSSGPVTLFDFASGDAGWVFNTYQAKDATTGAVVKPFNLVVDGNLSGGDLDAGVAAPTLAADSTVGNPPGSLKVVVTFTGYDQQVNPNINWGQNALQDWTGKTVSVDIKVDPFPSDTTNLGGIMPYAQDTVYAGQYGWSAFPTDNQWHTYTLDMTKQPLTLDPAKIIQFTVQFASAAAPTDDAGVPPFSPTTVTAYIDNITVQ